MDDILFDSRSELDKIPFGAVAAGTAVRFGIRTAENLGVSAVKLIAVNDENGERREYVLSHAWTGKGYDRFEGGAAFENAGLYWYWFVAELNETEHIIEKTAGGAGFAESEPRSWQLSVYYPDYSTPEWIIGGAFYQIFVDRFKKSGNRPLKEGAVLRGDWGGVPVYRPDSDGRIRNNDFFGGDLDGVIEMLPHLADFGITCIYLNPVFEADSNHKYDTADYSKIDPSFGDEDNFKTLCAEAGKLGVRVICDGVFNHTGADSVYFNKNGRYGSGGASRDKASPYYEWYTFTDWPDKYESWWGINTLPQIKKECPGFREFITGENGILAKWLSAGASGWRLDVADELSESFLRALRKRVKSEKPDALIIGEVWEDASNKVAYGSRRHYFQGEELDGVMNYPLKDAIIAYALSGNAEALRETVETLCENYPKPALDCLMNILGTHDTARILTVLSGKTFTTRDERAAAKLSGEDRKRAAELLHIASVLQFTLPGVPCIYYGDEAGMEGYEDPFNRRCYPWGSEDKQLAAWYKSLLAARKSCAAFAGGTYRTLRSDGGVFVFTRYKSGKKATVVVNMGNEAVSAGLSSRDKTLLAYNTEENTGRVLIRHAGCAVVQTAD